LKLAKAFSELFRSSPCSNIKQLRHRSRFANRSRSCQRSFRTTKNVATNSSTKCGPASWTSPPRWLLTTLQPSSTLCLTSNRFLELKPLRPV